MTRRAQENIACLVFLALFIGVIVLSLDFGPRARMIPLPLAVFGIVLTLIQLIWQNFGSTETLKIDLISIEGSARKPTVTPIDAQGSESSAAQPVAWNKYAGAYGIVAGLLALTLLFGPIPATFLFTAGYFLATQYYSVVRGLMHTVVFTLAIYLLFFVLLQIQPYYGVLAPLIALFD